MTESEFERLMQTIAIGWNEGDARTPALAPPGQPRIVSLKKQFTSSRR